MVGDLCKIIKGRLKPKNYKDSANLSNRYDHEEVFSMHIDDEASLDHNGDPTFEETLYATKLSSPPAMERHLLMQSQIICPWHHDYVAIRLSTVGGIMMWRALIGAIQRKRPIRGGNVHGVFINSVGLVRARSRRSPEYDRQSSMAAYNVDIRTTPMRMLKNMTRSILACILSVIPPILGGICTLPALFSHQVIVNVGQSIFLHQRVGLT